MAFASAKALGIDTSELKTCRLDPLAIGGWNRIKHQPRSEWPAALRDVSRFDLGSLRFGKPPQ